MNSVRKIIVTFFLFIVAVASSQKVWAWDATDFIIYEPVEWDDVCSYVMLGDVEKILTDNGFHVETEGKVYDEMRQEYCRTLVYRKSDVERAVVFFHPEYEEQPMMVDITFPDEELCMAFCRNAILKMNWSGDGVYFIDGFVESGVLLEIKGNMVSVIDNGPM